MSQPITTDDAAELRRVREIRAKSRGGRKGAKALWAKPGERERRSELLRKAWTKVLGKKRARPPKPVSEK